jgi:hypothetical protein
MLGLGRWWSNVEQLAGEREVVGLHAAHQQTVVTDAVKAGWQDVDQEPADELVWVERHGLVAAWSLDPVVLDLDDFDTSAAA